MWVEVFAVFRPSGMREESETIGLLRAVYLLAGLLAARIAFTFADGENLQLAFCEC